jgi:aryl-alcohol dehydrogenase-like predicted oxidoreductase
MQRRPFPALGTDVTCLGLGTWGLSGEAYGPVSDAEADAVIERASELGIGLFDTADCYAGGAMQRRLGVRLRARSASAIVVTRIGTDRGGATPRKCFEPAYLREAVEHSRDRLGRDRLDVCLLHNPSVVTVERGEATGLLAQLKGEGAIGAWGVSAGSLEVALAAVEAGAAVLSTAYNLFHSRDLHAVAGEVAMRGVCVLAHSVLAYGLLAAHWGPDRTFDEGDHRRERWDRASLRTRVEQLAVARQLVGGEVLTPRAASLRFVLSNSLVSCALLGPRTTAQLDQLVREAGRGPPYLPEAELSALPARLAAAGVTT